MALTSCELSDSKRSTSCRLGKKKVRASHKARVSAIKGEEALISLATPPNNLPSESRLMQAMEFFSEPVRVGLSSINQRSFLLPAHGFPASAPHPSEDRDLSEETALRPARVHSFPKFLPLPFPLLEFGFAAHRAVSLSRLEAPESLGTALFAWIDGFVILRLAYSSVLPRQDDPTT
ncbi:uncharacterized protein LOC120286602 [Eucalyptus grandis]|uniref:uncharacterized protein LOC120286602 n=1 Tax=Eucalyptus grandis TaxID=71139 RepID=UPI00192EA21E|nr:uncharacterized protein LOC120286602 [Eucalyptus grandis]